jgi:hypothetical protein
MTSTPSTRLRALERMARAFEKENRYHEAGILRTTIHCIRVLLDPWHG